MTVTSAANSHYRAQQTIARRTAQQAQDLWAGVESRSVLDSWLARIAEMVTIITRGQEAVAALSQPYLDAVAAAQEIPTPPVGLVNPLAFAGVAADGRPLTSLLMQPALRTLGLLSGGADSTIALRSGLFSLVRIVDTEISDTSRAADQTGMVARRAWVKYMRHVSLPACGRCLVLAGRTYSWSMGFERHPQCDCGMVALREGDADLPTAQDLFAKMTPAQQAKAFTVAGAEAIRLGADPSQVVNARRGMRTSGGRLVTTEGTTRHGVAGRQAGATGRRQSRTRPMPEQLLSDAQGDRDLAIHLLQKHGYLSTRAR